MVRTALYADPAGVFVHDSILAACRKFPRNIALVDTSLTPFRRMTYAEYGDLVERLARGFVAAGVAPNDVLGIYLPNCWEFAVAYHAATLAGAIPTPLNPSYREREVRFQLENSGAVALVTDGSLISGVNLGGLPNLRRVYATRSPAAGAEPFADLLKPVTAKLPSPSGSNSEVLAALPYSSGTTGLPKGVMLSHYNLISNVYQLIAPGGSPLAFEKSVLCYLPLYHIYGLNVVLNPILTIGATLVLMPRFDLTKALELIGSEGVTTAPSVPPVINQFCQAAEKGLFPRHHKLHWVKSGAAPLAAELARRFTELTGIQIIQGYGMTEASPVTHIGVENNPYYVAHSIGAPVALTDCRLLDESGADVATDMPGELVMRGPQFMVGYWKNPQATSEVMHDGWFWSGDVARRDQHGFFFIIDRRKELIKYKGFPVPPAEVEAVLLEHPAVRDCGVVARPDADAGEIPCAFVVLREGFPDSTRTQSELSSFVAERLTSYKQPREVHFVASIPRNPSGKILRRELRKLVSPVAGE